MTNGSDDDVLLQVEVEELRGLVRELLRFVPHEKPEQGPLPNWIVNVRQRALVAVDDDA